MKPTAGNEKQIRQYLLGKLSEEQQDRFEEQYFADDNLFQEIQVLRDELIDDYLKGELSGQERRLFESHFLASPSHRQKVEFARAFAQTLSDTYDGERVPTRTQERSWWQSLFDLLGGNSRTFALAAATVLVAIGGMWLMFATQNRVNQAVPEQIAQVQTAEPSPDTGSRPPSDTPREQAQDKNRQELYTPEPPAPQPEPKRAQQVVSFALAANLVRDDATKKLIVPQTAGTVELQLPLEGDDYKSYRAVLGTVEGKQVLNQAALKPQKSASGNAIVLRVPAKLLGDNDYILRLSGGDAEGGFEDISKYYFRVVRR